MEISDDYYKGLLFLSYLLIISNNEINDNELYYLHKMRVEEGMTNDAFAEYLNSLIGKPEKEIYQIGINAMNCCADELKMRALSILNKMASSDKLFTPKEVQLISYAINIPVVGENSMISMNQPKDLAA